MLGLQELKAANERAAKKELADMRADTITYLRMVAEQQGNDGIRSLLVEAIPAWANGVAFVASAPAKGRAA